MNKWRYWPVVVVAVLTLALLVLSLGVPIDPDMGWHLANGSYILEHLRLPPGDIYSWTMPGYPWVPHEWGSDVIMAALNQLGGLWAVTILFALVVAAAFYVVSGAVPISRITRLFVAIVGLLISWTVVGVRPQMITVLGIAVVLYLLFRWQANRQVRWLWWLPGVFLVWANLHGGFPAGLGLVVLFGVAELARHILSAKSRRRDKTLLTTAEFRQLAGWWGLAVVATFINPNTWRVYWELYQTFVDRDVLNRILEWLPVTLTSIGSYNMALMVALLVGLLIVNRGRFDTTKLIMVVAVLIFSLTSWRHVPLFALTAMVLLAEQMEHYFGDSLEKQLSTWLGISCLVIVVFLAGAWQIFRIGHVIASPATYGEVYRYPYAAVQYLKAHPTDSARMFNEYGWGGYLIWQMPEQKVFIDGRMAIWRHPDFNVFDDLSDVTGVDAQAGLDVLERWDIDLVLINSNRPINKFLYAIETVQARIKEVLGRCT